MMVCISGVLFSGCTSQKSCMEFYVSPDGDDRQTGAMDAPFRTVEKAQEAVRAYKQSHGLPRGGITVWLRGGVYPMRQTLHFTQDDSGKEGAPVVYKAYPGEEVYFSGGQEIRFEPLDNSATRARIRAPHDQIVQANLKAQGITNFGSRKATGFGRATEPTPLELFFNHQPMTLARYPNNNEWMRIASVPQTGETLFGGDERTGRGVHYGRFAYAEDRVAGWRQNDDIWLQGYWTWDWADSFVKVEHIDIAKKEFILGEPHGSYGYSPNQRYFAMNILEELDSPGEWFLDKTSGILYFWPPSPVEEGRAFVSIMEDLMVHFDHTEYVRIEGITFEYTRGSVVRIEGGCHNLIGGCVIRNIGNDAVRIDGGHHNGVSGCDLYNLGAAGIWIEGGDRLTLTPGHNFANNNHIHHFSRINWTYRPAISLNGCGNRMAHNYIHDSPHMAVGFGGNDHVFEYNEGEIDKDIVFEVRQDLLEVIREDRSFGYLFQFLLVTFINAEELETHKDYRDWTNDTFKHSVNKAIKYTWEDAEEYIATLENIEEQIKYLAEMRRKYLAEHKIDEGFSICCQEKIDELKEQINKLI